MASVVLLHLNGVDTSTTITDDGAGGATWTASGNAQLDTAQKQFGSASLLLDGTGDYISSTTVPSSWRSSGWTVDFWMRLPATSSVFLFNIVNPADPQWGVVLTYNGTRLQLSLSSNGSSNFLNNANGTKTDFTTDTWYHIAVTYDNSDTKYYVYVDGVSDLATSSGLGTVTSTATSCFIGRLNGSTTGNANWIDEFHVDDTCLYPGGTTFTPPSAEYATPVDYSHLATDGFTLGGAASYYKLPFELVATGGFTFGGTAGFADDPTDLVEFELAGTGGFVFGGEATTELPNDDEVDGTIDATLPALSAELTGRTTNTGAIAATLPALRSTVVGGRFYINAVLPSLSSSLTGYSAVLGTIAARLPRLTSSLTGAVTVYGSISASMPRPRAALTSLHGATGTIAATLPNIRSSVTAFRGVAGTISATLPGPVVADINGFVQVTGTIAATLPVPSSAFVVLLQNTTSVITLSMNVVTSALSKYDNYAFNSYAKFGNYYLAADSNGIHTLDTADTDNGTAIAARWKTGALDFGDPMQKRLDHAYVAGRLSGDVTLAVKADEGTAVTVTLDDTTGSTIAQQRVRTARGQKGRYWEFDYQNVSGADFEIDTTTVGVVPLKRRI